MDFEEVRQARVFVLRLEHGEVIHEAVEHFATEQGVSAAALIALGGIDAGSRLVVGPKRSEQRPVEPEQLLLEDVHEVAGTGTLFPDEQGWPRLHMHLACGREADSVTGCIRSGVVVWQILEMVMFELTASSMGRSLDACLGFKLLGRCASSEGA